MNPPPMKQDKATEPDRRVPVRRTLEKLEIEDAERKPRLWDRIKSRFSRRRRRSSKG